MVIPAGLDCFEADDFRPDAALMDWSADAGAKTSERCAQSCRERHWALL
jgi:hypothetical protein